MKDNMPFASLELIYEKICHSQLSKKLAYFYFKVIRIDLKNTYIASFSVNVGSVALSHMILKNHI